MANPNNLLRPPILNNIPPPNPSAPQDPLNNPQMEAAITNLVTQICREQCRNAVEKILHPNVDIVVEDQIIEERYRENLNDMDKVPDIVRCLRDFSGNPSEFSSWKKSVERVLKIYETQKGTPRYFAILNVVRNKITGAADSALESYNTPLCWEAILRCLTIHYADKRDIATLEYQLTTLVQGNSSVHDFYQEVYSHLSLIINNISCMTIGREAMDVLIQTYRDKALDTFIRGLRGDLSKLLCIREPTSLPQALHLCLKLQNQNFRTDHALNRNPKLNNRNQNYRYQTTPTSFPHPQPIIQRNNQHTVQHPNQYPTHYPNPFYAQHNYPVNGHIHNPIQSQQPQRQNYNAFQINPRRPDAPKPLPKPIPMEIDQSIQTKNVNYINRPYNNERFMGKRPPESTLFQQQKFQKNYNIVTNTENENEHSEAINSCDTAEEPQSFEDYYNQISQYDDECNAELTDKQEFSDIYFLD